MNLTNIAVCKPHAVALLPGDTLAALRGRWEATAPTRHIGPIFIR